MKYIPRVLNLKEELKKKSYFLLGPRQTGKSTIIRKELSDCRTYNLLLSDVLLELSRNPSIIRHEVTAKDKIVVIDEIQKLPQLLDEVQYLIEEKGINFLLTGSSARKLRRGGVNLLGGRARSKFLFPFTSHELLNNFNLHKALNIGLLPSIYFSDEPRKDLKSYVGSYLKEEIVSEALVRNIPAFSRFLEIAALGNAQMLNYTNIGNDAQVPTSTVVEYYEILKDTLIISFLPAWKETIKRKPISTSKVYFFDSGVVRSIQSRKDLSPKTEAYGEALETFMHNEIKAYLEYSDKEGLHYWRSKSGYEVDFIIAEKVAVELKSQSVFSPKLIKGLKALKEENLLERYILVSNIEREKNIDGIEILPISKFLSLLWEGEIV